MLRTFFHCCCLLHNQRNFDLEMLLEGLVSHKSLLIADIAVCLCILIFVPYTEVDWVAYMQEVEGFLNGERDYTKLHGDTGPLVYPAGFVYLYSALYYVTGGGAYVWLAQWIFTAVYLTLTAIVMHIYGVARVPFVYTVALVMSRRVHSIFLLRLFNDGIAMLLMYTSVVSTAWRDWKQGALWLSLAVSVKMNVLLFAPGMLAVWISSISFAHTMVCLGICAAVQVALGFPFLTSYPLEYVSKAFELSRVFTYKWTVNFKFLPEEVFTSPALGLALLLLTISSWVVLVVRRWRHRDMRDPRNVILTLFESNVCGVVFSRTMHYQFYSWFFHQVPLLLCLSWPRRWHWIGKVVVWGCLEYGFTVYPSTPASSGVLMFGLLTLWLGIILGSDDDGDRVVRRD